MSRLVFVYMLLPAAMAVLFFLSRKTVLPSQIEDTGISRAFLKISLYIYRIVRRRSLFSGERIRMYLGTLGQKKDVESLETEYFIRKISIVLLMATAGSVLSLAMCLGSLFGGRISEEGTVKRNSFGERDYDLELVATDEAGAELGEYELEVRTRQFEKRELEVMFDEALGELEGAILGDNESPDEVRTDLDLVERIDGYPFDIRWKVDNYEVMHFDGKLKEENIPEGGTPVTLTATFSYGEERWQYVFNVNVLPKILSPAERTFKEVEKLLKSADEESLSREEIRLPGRYGAGEVTWTEKRDDNSILILLLALIGGAASFVLKDRELKESIRKREDELISDYPKLVSKLVLYMGAGMTVRNIFAKEARIYVKELERGGKKRYLGEEILHAYRELMTGESEAEVYERFGQRCSIRQYTRLTTLLVQNLRKGNSELLTLLQEEAKKAFEERMDRVRKTGEEAGTKLLMPMVIMLIIVMLIIIIPAYTAF